MSENITVQILINIRDEMAGMRGELGALRTELREGLADVNTRVDGTNARLDNLIETMGGSRKEHGERIGSLEERVEKLERGVPRRRPTGGPRRRS